MSFPQTFRLKQRFHADRVADISSTVTDQVRRLNIDGKVKAGQTVAITAGSRGIANIAEVLAAVAQSIKDRGARPFIFPAMGSHGGATAEGQRHVIESYGVTEEYCGCEIRSSMETVTIGDSPDGYPVHFDKHAYEADHILICNRVKVHTDFTGRVQSGLIKMMLIGCGNRNGAYLYHRATEEFGFDHMAENNVPLVLENCNVLGGIAIVENGYDEIGLIEAVPVEQIIDREPALLKLSAEWMPRLPFPECDVLVLDEIGKNISGTGMDTNVVGRKYREHAAVDGEVPKVKRIAVRGLSEATHGNALGIGLSEFCRTRVLEEMDPDSTRVNSLTSGRLPLAMKPVDFATDKEMLAAALKTIGLVPPERAGLIWAHNTLELSELECSERWLDEAHQREELEVVSQLRELPFDPTGNLPSVTSGWTP